MVTLALVLALCGPPVLDGGWKGVREAPTLAVAQEHMREDLETYFAGEKRESWLWLAAGLGAEGAGAALLANGGGRARGAAYPVMGIGLIQLSAAAYLFWRTDDQIGDYSALLASNPLAYARQEGLRMQGVNRGFDVYKWVELGFVLGGAGMAVGGARTERPTLEGAGYGLAIQGLVMLAFDWFAERRARRYATQIEWFSAYVACDRLREDPAATCPRFY